MIVLNHIRKESINKSGKIIDHMLCGYKYYNHAQLKRTFFADELDIKDDGSFIFYWNPNQHKNKFGWIIPKNTDTFQITCKKCRFHYEMIMINNCL